jgi:hypothetical protein
MLAGYAGHFVHFNPAPNPSLLQYLLPSLWTKVLLLFPGQLPFFCHSSYIVLASQLTFFALMYKRQ